MKTTIKNLLRVLTATALLAIGLFWLISPASPPASQLFINAQVLTMDADNRTAEAVALEGERIVAVGTNEEIMALKTDASLLHDLQGKTLMPGIIDAHGHFPGSGLSAVAVDLNSPPIGDVTTVAGLQARLKAKLADKPAGEWLVGFGYDDTLLEGAKHPSRQQLDAVSTKHPIYIMHVSGHMGVANSLALQLAGYDDNSPNPEGGVLVKDAEGKLTGLLEEKAGEPVAKMGLDMSPWDFFTMINSAIDEYAAVGVTTAQSGGVDTSMLQGIGLASKLGVIPFRLELWPLYDKAGQDILSGELDLTDFNTERLRTKTIKIVADGSIQGFTGYLSHPYHSSFREDEHYRGYPIMSREKLAEQISAFHGAGYQLAIHGNGDAAIDDIIYGFEKALQQHPVADPRMILIHSQMARDDQLDDMKRLGITPSFFSAHTYYWGDRHRDIFMGEDRAMRMSPAKSAEDRGLRYTVHMDTPVVPMSPMLMVWSTVNRLSSSGKTIGAEQRVSPITALRAVTIDAAWQIFRDDDLGSIETGKLADLVVLERSPLENPLTIKDIQVEQTFVGGVNIFNRNTLTP